MQVGVRLLDGHSDGQRREDGEDVQGILQELEQKINQPRLSCQSINYLCFAKPN